MENNFSANLNQTDFVKFGMHNEVYSVMKYSTENTVPNVLN